MPLAPAVDHLNHCCVLHYLCYGFQAISLSCQQICEYESEFPDFSNEIKTSVRVKNEIINVPPSIMQC